MLKLNLTPIFNAKGIERPYSFLVKAGLTPHTANSLLHSKTRIFRLDHIEKLCLILKCEPNDLLLWTPDNNELIPENHSLKKLQQNNTNQIDLQETLLKMPYRELKSLTEKIKQNKEENK